jgi:hypothetical protein
MSEPRERIREAISVAGALLPPKARSEWHVGPNVFVEIDQRSLDILARCAEAVLKEHTVYTAVGGKQYCDQCEGLPDWPCPVLLEIVKPKKEEA